MSTQKTDDIVNAIDNLPLRERINTLITAISNLPPDARFTVLEEFKQGAVVLIYDQDGVNLTSPCALVIYDRDTSVPIDIMASVRENADGIRHPAISLAIRRWSNCIASQSALARNKNRVEAAKSELVKGSFFKKAQKHLQNIGRALSRASRSQQKMKAAIAFASEFQQIDEGSVRFLRVCWNVLRKYKNEINKGVNDEGDKYIRTRRERHQVFEAKVLKFFSTHGFEDDPFDTPLDEEDMKTYKIFFEQIFPFFEDFGSAFFDNPNQFRVMQSKYTQWRTGLSAEVISKYRGEIKRVKPQKIADPRFLSIPTDRGENQYHTSELDDCFRLPIVPCKEPKCKHRQHPRFQETKKKSSSKAD